MFVHLLCWLTLTITPSFGAVWFVPDDFATPQAALDNSSSEDTVVLRDGTYLGPIMLPQHSITLGSESILDEDTVHIAACRVIPDSGAMTRRCLDTLEEAVDSVYVRIIGLTIADARCTGNDSWGGGLRLRYRAAYVSDCVFEECLATRGGAMYVEQSEAYFSSCTFRLNDALSSGRVLRGLQSTVVFANCDVGPSGYLADDPSTEAEFVLDDCEFKFLHGRIHGLGTSAQGRATALSLIDRSLCDSIVFRNCTIDSNAFSQFFSGGRHGGMRNLLLDSCRIIGNTVAYGFLVASDFDSLRRVVITRCAFEGNRIPGPQFGGAGLLTFDGTCDDASCDSLLLADCRFHDNEGGAFSCVQVNGDADPAAFRLRRNTFTANRNFNVTSPPGGAVFTSSLDSGIFERNAFHGNIGHAFDTWEFGATGHAVLNWWGDATGPYEPVSNPTSLGDTTDQHTVYDPWLLSEEQIFDSVAEAGNYLPSPTLPFLTNAYPNPFNSSVTIEFVLSKDQDIALEVFDLIGRRVETIYNGRMRKGVHVRDWIPNGKASGIYFAKLSGDDIASTVKMLYLK